MCMSMEYELCYQELEHGRELEFNFNGDNFRRCFNSRFELKHSVANIEIIGVFE